MSFQQKHLSREQVQRFYEEGLRRVEGELWQAHVNARIDPSNRQHDEQVKKLKRQLALLEDDFKQWQEANSVEAPQPPAGDDGDGA